MCRGGWRSEDLSPSWSAKSWEEFPVCLSRTEESRYPSEDLRMASVVSRWRDPVMSGQGRFDPRVMTLLRYSPCRWKKMAKMKVLCKRLPSYNYVQIVSLMSIADPLICVGNPGLALTLGGVDDIRYWLVWLRREDLRPCKLCVTYMLRKFLLFSIFQLVCVW